MPGGRGPKSNIGVIGNVQIDDVPLRIASQSYEVLEIPSAVDPHDVVGPWQYQAFGRFEGAETQNTFDGGYGLNRYVDFRGDPNQAHTMIKEAAGVDCRNDVALLSPALLVETMSPAPSGDVIWLGEINGTMYAVAEQTGACVWKRNTAAPGSGIWTQQSVVFSNTATPLRQAVGVFNGAFLVGFGAAAVAMYTTDFVNALNVKDNAGTPNNLFVYAYTSDHASAYIAGGASTANLNQVMASTDGHTFQTTSATTCGGTDNPITGLAPGMGVATVMVGKSNELGMIDLGSSGVQGASPLYRSLVPFDTRHPSNCLGMHWWMGRATDEQLGPPILWFPRDRDPWIYSPATTSSGQARNVAPWAQPDMHPPNVRGLPVVAAGTGRWLYYAIQNPSTSQVYLNALDSHTLISAPFLKASTTNTRALAITGLYGNPTLYVPTGHSINAVILPQDSEYPPDDSQCRYATSGTLDLPDMEGFYPLEPKVLDSVVVAALGLSPLQQRVQILASLDGGAYTTVGVADTTENTEILFDPDAAGNLRPTAYRVGLRAVLSTTDSTKTPQLYAIGLRFSINPELQKAWRFVAPISPGSSLLPSDDLGNPHTVLDRLWQIRRAGVPVIFTDIWGDQHQAHVHEIHEMNMALNVDDEPEMVAQILMCETPGAVGTTTGVTFPYLQYVTPVPSAAAFYPFGFPVPMNSSEMIIPNTTLANNHTTTQYPIVVIAGPGNSFQLNTTAGGSIGLNYELKPGQTVTINMDPTKHTVIDNQGNDLSAYITGTFWGIPVGGTTISGQMLLTDYLSYIQVDWSPF